MTVQTIGNPLSGSKRSSQSSTPRLQLVICLLVLIVGGAATFFYMNSATSSLDSDLAAKRGVEGGGAEHQHEHDADDHGDDEVMVDAIIDKHRKQKPNFRRLGGDRSITGSSSNLHNNISNNKPLRVLTLATNLGDVKIQLRPDLSPESVSYIERILAAKDVPCSPCNFYRAEKPGILQGILKKSGVPINKVLGKCPKEYRNEPAHTCPPHDPNCGCHGPIMTRGMVGWAAGKGGPDFFISMDRRKATWWKNEHTVWGEIVDNDSLNIVDQFFELPATRKGGLTYLDDTVHIDVRGDRAVNAM